MPLAGAAQQGTPLLARLQRHLLAGDGKDLSDPSSVLDHRPSPTATSTLSSPLSDVAALAGAWPPGDDDAGGGKEDWVHHLPPLDMSWDPPAQRQQRGISQLQADDPFLRWIIAGDDTAQAMDHIPSSSSVVDDTRPPPPFGFGPSIVGRQSHGAFPFSSFHTAPTQQHPTMAGALKPKAEEAPSDDAAAVAEAAKLAEAGNVLGAREILARLNHRLPTAGTPLHRSAFYFKEALRAALSTTAGDAPSSPVDVVLKLGAYKAFSEVSPVIQFAHLTCVQAVLDELGGAGCIHVLDFDIGVGEQWASLMQELAQRRPGAALKVTALVPTAMSHHPLELQLVHENLSNFAADTGVPFQFAVFILDAMGPTELLAIAGGDDAIAVHLPLGSAHTPAVPSVLRLARRLGAKLVVTIDRSCDRGELPFAAHLFQAFQSCVLLLESLDAVGTGPDVAARIERFLIQPRIQSCVVNKYRAGSRTPPWRTMLASAGFVPVQASSLAEAQADSLLKKMPVRGFRVEKRAGSLVLHWQRGELVSVTAWRC